MMPGFTLPEIEACPGGAGGIFASKVGMGYYEACRTFENFSEENLQSCYEYLDPSAVYFLGDT
jgi:hypothetical protein